MITRNCKQCHKEFKVHQCWIRGKNKGCFCSKACFYRWQRLTSSSVSKPCEVCNMVIRVFLCQIKHNLGRFCSKKCQRTWLNKNVIGFKPSSGLSNGYYYTGENTKVHVAVVKAEIGRDLKPGETIHHIDGGRLNNDPANLFLFRTSGAHTRWHRFLKRHNLKGLLESNLKTYSFAQ